MLGPFCRAHDGIFQIAIFGQKASNIRAKPLEFWASTGENIRPSDLSPSNQTGFLRRWPNSQSRLHENQSCKGGITLSGERLRT